MKTYITKSTKNTQPKEKTKGASLAPPPFQRMANKRDIGQHVLPPVIQQRGHQHAFYVVNINGQNYYRANVRGHQNQLAVVQAALASAGAPAAQIRSQGSRNRAPANGILV